MDFKKLTLSVFSICFLPSLVLAGNAYYVDCSAGVDGTGSYASPWNNISSVNSHNFGVGDDVYFKVNTTCVLGVADDKLKIDWSGVNESDRTVIGAYYGDGQFGLNGNSRPIIDGDGNRYPGADEGAVEINNGNVSYVTVKDLKIQYSGMFGVLVKMSDNISVENCYIYRPYGSCIVYATYGVTGDGVDTGTISHNICENAGYPDYEGKGAAIEISGMGWSGSTTNITVSRNIVKNGKSEGIGFYKKVTDSIAEYNVVHDMKSFHLYVDASQYITFRYNLVYESTDRVYPTFSESEYGIVFDNEIERGYGYSGYYRVYGNLVAGMARGISLGCEQKANDPDFVCFKDTKVYNNTFVDNEYNFTIWTPDSRDSIEIKNNISWTISDGTYHANNYSPAGVTWNNNNFDDPVSGNAATNSKIYAPGLKKDLDWRFLAAGNVDGTEFSLTPDSQNQGSGVSIIGYNDRIYASDYTADKITVNTAAGSNPSIGAWMGDPATCTLDARFIETTLGSGVTYYTDRTYTLTDVPSEYIGMDLILLPMMTVSLRPKTVT